MDCKRGTELKRMAISILNDGTCIEQLKTVGRLDILAVPPGKYSATTFYTYNGFWVMASHFDHHDNGDNGYAILMLPQTQVTEEEATEFFNVVLVQGCGGGDPKHLTYVQFDNPTLTCYTTKPTVS